MAKNKGKVLNMGGAQSQPQQLKLDPAKLETVSCPNCDAVVIVYHGKVERNEEDTKNNT